MTTQPTNLPVPSESPRDLKFNAGKIDEFVTSEGYEYIDRFGNEHRTITGINYDANQAMLNYGYITKKSFEVGATLDTHNTVLQWESNGEFYRWDGDWTQPKVVPAGSTPDGTGGIGEGKWVGVGDASLRGDLAGPSGATLVEAQDGRNIQEWIIALDNAEYRSKNISYLASVNYKCRTKQAIKIVCQGDSITAGYDVYSTDTVPSDGGDGAATHASITYPERLQSFLSGIAGIATTVEKRAISGHTAKNGWEKYTTNPNGNLVFLMYGINDSKGNDGATHEEYMTYMEKLIRRYIDWGHGVVVMTCAHGGNGEGNPSYQMYAQEAKNMAKIYGCAVMDAHEAFYNMRSGVVQSDGTHFNSLGYSKLGEACAAMIMAGGLLPHYSSLKSELHVWPGAQSDTIGYYDRYENIGTGYYNAAYTLQAITGTMVAGQPSIATFSFYLESEAAEVDLVGSWADQDLNVRMTQNISGTVTRPSYYDMPEARSSVWAHRDAWQTTGYKLRDRSGGTLNGLPRRLGTLVGRGWKTIVLFTDLINGSTAPAYIQGLTIRTVPVHTINEGVNGSSIIKGEDEVYTYRFPYRSRDESDISAPPASALANIRIPLPKALYGLSFNNNNNYFDCGIVELTVRSVGGTAGGGIMKATLCKTATGNGLVVVETFRNNTKIPTITAAVLTVPQSVLIAANSIQNQMPVRDIVGPGTPTSNISGSAFGRVLDLYMAGTETAYWHVEIRGATLGSGASGSTCG